MNEPNIINSNYINTSGRQTIHAEHFKRNFGEVLVKRKIEF